MTKILIINYNEIKKFKGNFTMKKKIIIVIAIVILIIVGVIFVLNNSSTYNKNFSKDINSKIEIVKSIATNDIYFPFEENNKQYMLLGYRISSYSDLEKSSMKIQNINYKNGDLIIELEISEVRARL